MPAFPRGASHHARGEILGRLHALQRSAKLIFKIRHSLSSGIANDNLRRNTASDRCKWLFTVATGISNNSAISVGVQTFLKP